MKKLLSILILLYMAVPVFAQPYTIIFNGVNLNIPNPPANTWWISSAGSGTKDGKSLANAAALASFNYNPVASRDVIHYCGTFNQQYNPSGLSSGLSGYPITLDGSCPGGIPAVWNPVNLISSTWTLVSSNVYSTPMAPGTGPYTAATGSFGIALGGIIAEDDAALIMVPWLTDISTTMPTMLSTTATFSRGSWTYDGANGILYVLTTDATDPTGHTMEASYGQNFSETFLLNGKSNITIQNFTMKHSGDYGFVLEGGSTNDVFTNNNVYETKNWGLVIENSSNAITSNNIFKNNVWIFHLPCPQSSFGVGETMRYDNVTGGSIFGNDISGNTSAGVDLHGGTNGVSVYANKIHDNLGIVTQYSPGIYSDNAQNNFIYDNNIYREIVCWSLNGENSGSSTSGTYVYNNLCYDWFYTGMYFGGNAPWTQSQSNFAFNNTFVVGPDATTFNQALAVQQSVNDTFKNNIVYGNVYWMVPAAFQSFTPGNFDYNQYFNASFNGQPFANWQAVNMGDTHSASTNPSIGSIFVGSSIPPDTNFELTGGSPALGVGTNLSSIFTTDYGGNTRPSSGPWSVGAYE